jgi:hypothetical protein
VDHKTYFIRLTLQKRRTRQCSGCCFQSATSI